MRQGQGCTQRKYFVKQILPKKLETQSQPKALAYRGAGCASAVVSGVGHAQCCPPAARLSWRCVRRLYGSKYLAPWLDEGYYHKLLAELTEEEV